MTPEEIAAKAEADATAATEKTSQDPLKVEAERINKEKEGRTELEKAIFTRNKINSRIKELGGDAVDPIADPDNEDDKKPVTVGDLKRIEADKAAQTALTLANEIADETERELVIHHLNNSVRPSGDAKGDLAKARAIVNEVKNRQIAEEATRRQDPKRNGHGSGSPGRSEGVFEATPEEMAYMKPPFNLTKEKILEARKKAEGSK